MKLQFKAFCLAALGGAASLLTPASAEAGNVGYYGSCNGGNPSAQIALAGHTAVAVGSLDAATLAPLSALIIANCNGATLPAGADLHAAVFAGMDLIVDDWNPNAGTAANLPGSPAITFTLAGGADLNLAAGSPIATGPGGTLTDTSLDGGTSSNHGYTLSSLPAGFTSLLTTADPAQKVGIAYAHGAGMVVYNAMPLDHYLPGGAWDQSSLCTASNVCAGMRTYLTNALAWATGYIAPPTTTCASEGYTGTKLNWCKIICESESSAYTIDTYLRRWINRYHDLPYCAVEEEQQPG